MFYLNVYIYAYVLFKRKAEMCTWKDSVLTFIRYAKCQDAKALPRNYEDLSNAK